MSWSQRMLRGAVVMTLGAAGLSTSALAQSAVPAVEQIGHEKLVAPVPNYADLARWIDNPASDTPARQGLDRDVPCGTTGQPGAPGSGSLVSIRPAGSAGVLTADNFRVAAGGSQTLTSISWRGAYTLLTLPAGTTGNGAPPATETFRVRVLANNGQVPGAELYNQTVTNPSRVVTSDVLAGGITVYEWTLNLPGTAPVLNGDTCYWLEISNTAPGALQLWRWELGGLGSVGDVKCYQNRTVATGDTYTSGDQLAFDLAFCVNVTTDTTTTCGAYPTASTCDNNAANGQPRDAAVGNAFTTGSNSPNSVTGTVAPNTAGVLQQWSDGYQSTVNGNITSICFTAGWWSFNTTTGGAAEPVSPDFDVTYSPNITSTGLPDTVGTTTFHVGDPGVSLIRRGNANYMITHPPFAVQAGRCYHVAISYRADFNDLTRRARMAWILTSTGTVGDGILETRFTTGTWIQVTNILSGTTNIGQETFVPNVGPGATPNCLPAPPANQTCAGAIPLAIPSVTNGSNVNAQLAQATPLPSCIFNNLEGPSVWYTLVGTGNAVNLSTCNANTNFDTVISVFCSANGCAGPFNCVAGNNNDPTPCGAPANASNVTFVAAAGITYYVVISGNGAPVNDPQVAGNFFVPNNNGNFVLTVADAGVATAQPCSAFARCSVAADPFTPTLVDDPCSSDAGFDNNATCGQSIIYNNFGETLQGFISTTAGAGGTRDIDWIALPFLATDTRVDFFLRSEAPTLTEVLNGGGGGCNPAPTVQANSTFFLAYCLPTTGAAVLSYTLPAGNNFFIITSSQYSGLPCGLNNEYRFRAEISPMGACCIAATACQVISRAECVAQFTGASDFFVEGLTCSNGPCDSAPGKCCLADGSCQLTPNATIGNEAACTAAGGVFTAAGVCTPNTCTPPAGACCCGSGCSITTAAACSGTNQRFAGTGTVCNAAGNFTTPCCKGDYNKAAAGNVISVQDIFDFLTGYFSGSLCADTNASGNISVQDIFDFLSAYFGGC